jgi:outer membrane biosynthesis protein TonB
MEVQMIERVANVFGKVGFHGTIGIMTVGTIVFVCVYGVVQEPANDTVLAELTTTAFTTLVVATGGLLAGAAAVFRQSGSESDKPVEEPKAAGEPDKPVEEPKAAGEPDQPVEKPKAPGQPDQPVEKPKAPGQPEEPGK